MKTQTKNPEENISLPSSLDSDYVIEDETESQFKENDDKMSMKETRLWSI